MTMSSPKPDIILYTSGTPNGQKASITLEELGVPYRVENIEISKNTQKEEWSCESIPMDEFLLLSIEPRRQTGRNESNEYSNRGLDAVSVRTL